MSDAKSEALRLIGLMPDDGTWEDVLHRLYLGASIARGVAAAEAGNVITHEEMKRQIEEWIAAGWPDHPEQPSQHGGSSSEGGVPDSPLVRFAPTTTDG